MPPEQAVVPTEVRTAGETTTRPGSTPQRAAADRSVHLIVFASGFAGLGYEMVWTRMLTLSLGHEIAAVLAVLAAFFLGLSVGALTLGRRLRSTPNPARWYAVLELLIGAWAVLLVWLIPVFNDTIPVLLGEQPSPGYHWAVAFCGTFVLLLPATAAMGATLPALERIYAQLFGPGHHVGSVYGANTFGAVLGTLTTTFVLVPALGSRSALLICAALSVVCALAVLWVAGSPARPDPVRSAAGRNTGTPRLLATLFLTGLLGLAYEVLVIRVLSQVLEDTVFTFAVVLGIYLLGTALGALIYQKRLAAGRPAANPNALIILTSFACLLGTASLWLTDIGYEWINQAFARSSATAFFGEVSIALMVFLIPAVAMGMLFTHLAQRATAGVGLGFAIGINTLGAALAPLLAGVVLLPAAGARSALLVTALGYLGLVEWRSPGRRFVAVPVTVAVLLALLPPLRFISVPEGGEIIDFREGAMAAVAVVADATDTRYLKVNNHFTMGSTSSRFADHRQTHIPLLLHPDPQSVLYLGVGTGMTLDAARYHPNLAVTGVELLPETLEVMDRFGTSPEQNPWTMRPRLLASDARRFVLASQSEFDVIIGDLFHPSRDGAGALYTREHFDAVKERLSADGIFCQWLPLFQMDLDTFELIARTFADRFPHVQLHLPHFSLHQPIVGLIGSRKPIGFRPDYLVDRVHSRPLQRQLVDLHLNSDLALYGGFLADRDALTRYLGDGPLNTDDHTRVTYHAPAFAYRQQQDHAQRLVDLTTALATYRHRSPEQPSTDDTGFDRRLDAYWAARDAYLRAGIGVHPGDDFATLLTKTRQALLDVVRLSADFTSAYDPLLDLAQALYQRDPAEGRVLLGEIARAAPSRGEALAMLRALEAR